MNWREQAAGMLDRVFGRRFLSWRCFFASFIATLFTAMILIIPHRELVAVLNITMGHMPGNYWVDAFTFAILGALICNAVPNYLSVIETRLLLRLLVRSRRLSTTIALLFIDILLSLLFHFVFMYILINIDIAVRPDGSLGFVTPLNFVRINAISLSSEFDSALRFVIIFTSLTTSIWLWLYALSLVAVKFAKGNLPPNRWFSRWLDNEHIKEHAIALVGNMAATMAFFATLMAGLVMLAAGS